MRRLRYFIFAVFALGLGFAAASLPLRAQQDLGLPPGEGRDIVAVACIQCHSATAFTRLREGRVAWRKQVYDMVERGAQIRSSEIETVVNYLGNNFGPGVGLASPSAHVALPDGAAQELVNTHCSLCHGIERVVSVKRSKTAWNAIVTHMITLGAPLNTAQQKTVTEYLSAHFGDDQLTGSAHSR